MYFRMRKNSLKDLNLIFIKKVKLIFILNTKYINIHFIKQFIYFKYDKLKKNKEFNLIDK